MNVTTGVKGFYQYDNKDETLQRFNNERSENFQNVFSTYILIFIAMGILIAGLIGICVFQLMKFKKIEDKIKSARDKKVEEIKKVVSK